MGFLESCLICAFMMFVVFVALIALWSCMIIFSKVFSFIEKSKTTDSRGSSNVS